MSLKNKGIPKKQPQYTMKVSQTKKKHKNVNPLTNFLHPNSFLNKHKNTWNDFLTELTWNFSIFRILNNNNK